MGICFKLKVNGTEYGSPNIKDTYTWRLQVQIADELFECVWLFCEIGAKKVKMIETNDATGVVDRQE